MQPFCFKRKMTFLHLPVLCIKVLLFSHLCLTRYLDPACKAPCHRVPKLHESSFSPPDPNSAGQPRHTDPTKRPEQEAGTNGKSSTTSPFVKDHSGTCGGTLPWNIFSSFVPKCVYFTINVPEKRMS